MFKIYTPKEWNSIFDCPSLMIDDEGLIWKADEYYKVLFGEPSGRIDWKAGRIYGADLGYGLMAEPIAYMEEKNGVTEILDARNGIFSAPILYLKNDKIYTPEQYTAVFDCPGGYIREEKRAEETRTATADTEIEREETQRSSAVTGGGMGFMKLIGILFAIYIVVQGLFVGAPWLGWALPIGTTAFLLYKGFTLPDGDPRKEKSKVLGVIMGIITVAAMIFLGVFLNTL